MPEIERQRLLAVSHEASRTGAPIVLSALVGWLSRNTDLDIHTLLVDDGPLRSEFAAAGTVSSVVDRPGGELLGFIERGLRARGARRAMKLPAAVRYRTALATLGRFDIVYLNSLTTLDLLPYLRATPRIVAHIHEGALTIDAWRRTHAPDPSQLGRVDRWVSVSEDTVEALGAIPGIDPGSVSLHHPFIDVTEVRSAPLPFEQRARLRDTLGIPPGARVVVGSGTIERRKGPDLFVQLAAEVRRRLEPEDRAVHFVWVGGDLGGLDWPPLLADLQRTGADHVHVTGHVPDPRPYFQLADVFALTSREDPFPLVCLEHAALGVPIVAYDSSGIRSLLTGAGPSAAGGVISYLDVNSMADRVEALLVSPERAGVAAAELSLAVDRDHDIDDACAAIAADLGLWNSPEAPSAGSA